MKRNNNRLGEEKINSLRVDLCIRCVVFRCQFFYNLKRLRYIMFDEQISHKKIH
ncbi:hypothetical protein CHS0354_018828, partial [Potamilus streckersoni]